MTGTWIGKTRSNGLWSNINDYVKKYSDVNNISDDEPWLRRWHELITIHKITKSKRDYEFIAYVITGNPEATVNECLQHLFALIPFLDQHIEITATSVNGSIQYIYHDNELEHKDTPDDEQFDVNRYSTLQQENEANEQADKDLESVLKSDNSSTVNSPDTDLYNQALDTATSTLKKLSDYTGDPPTTSDDQDGLILDRIKTLCDFHTNTFKDTITGLSTNNERALRHIHNESFENFCEQCNSHIEDELTKLEETLQKRLHAFDMEIENKLHTYKTQLNKIEFPSKPTQQKPATQRHFKSPEPSKISSNNIRTTPRTPIGNFGATKTSVDTIPIQNFFQHNLKFEHQGDVYFLQDRDFLKNSPKIETPVSVDDGLTIYSQLQKNALIYNIFLTPIDEITIWDMDPNSVPTTCNLEIDDVHNFQQTYQRSAVAIYTKIQYMDFTKVPFFKQILEHERTSQDGYKVLYGMLCTCHPKLVEKSKQEAPTLATNGNLFSFIRQYTNYIASEQIANRHYTDLEKLSFVMTILENDGRFDKALAQLRILKNMFEEISKTTPQAKFPASLTLETLPYTIMKSYTAEEKHALFIDNNTTAVVRTFNNTRKTFRNNNNENNTRKRTNTTCKCCGISGHDVETSGCDFAASLLLTTNYLKENPYKKRNIITTFKMYQKQRLDNIKTRDSLSTRIKRSAQNKRIGITPTVQLLIEAIGDTIEDSTTDTTTDDILDISDILLDDSDNTGTDENFHDTVDPTTDSHE